VPAPTLTPSALTPSAVRPPACGLGPVWGHATIQSATPPYLDPTAPPVAARCKAPTGNLPFYTVRGGYTLRP